MSIKTKVSTFEDLVASFKWEAAAAILKKIPPVEAAEMLLKLEPEALLNIFKQLTVRNQANLMEHFPLDVIHMIYAGIDKKRFGQIFSYLFSDIRADFYRSLDREQQIELLPYLAKKVREDIIHLSSYETESAGGIMITDFATVHIEMNVAQALRKIKKDNPSHKMIYYIYVVNDEMKMLGFVTIKDLILAHPREKISELVKQDFISAQVEEDREMVVRKIEKYNLLAIPVLNSQGQIVGIITHDDALDVIRAEHTEDLEKFMGIVPVEEGSQYLKTSSWQHFLKRVVWITSLAIVGIISGMIIHAYETALEKLIILALYMPMVADTGGNTGSQAATVVVRALALGQISVQDWLKVIWKESKVAILLALVLGMLAFLKILFLSWETEVPTEYSLVQVAFVISLALSLQVITATIIGAGLPLLVKKFGGDPAVAASPAITTVVDITGLLLYFGTAVMLLQL